MKFNYCSNYNYIYNEIEILLEEVHNATAEPALSPNHRGQRNCFANRSQSRPSVVRMGFPNCLGPLKDKVELLPLVCGALTTMPGLERNSNQCNCKRLGIPMGSFLPFQFPTKQPRNWFQLLVCWTMTPWNAGDPNRPLMNGCCLFNASSRSDQSWPERLSKPVKEEECTNLFRIIDCVLIHHLWGLFATALAKRAMSS